MKTIEEVAREIAQADFGGCKGDGTMCGDFCGPLNACRALVIAIETALTAARDTGQAETISLQLLLSEAAQREKLMMEALKDIEEKVRIWKSMISKAKELAPRETFGEITRRAKELESAVAAAHDTGWNEGVEAAARVAKEKITSLPGRYIPDGDWSAEKAQRDYFHREGEDIAVDIRATLLRPQPEGEKRRIETVQTSDRWEGLSE